MTEARLCGGFSPISCLLSLRATGIQTPAGHTLPGSAFGGPTDCPPRPPSPLTSCPRPARRKDRRRPAHAPHTARDKYFPGNGTCSLCVYSQGPGRVVGEGPARGASSPGATASGPASALTYCLPRSQSPPPLSLHFKRLRGPPGALASPQVWPRLSCVFPGCKHLVLDACPCRLGFSNGRTCICPSLPRPWSVRDVDRWMDRQIDRLGWQLRSPPWPRSLHTLGLCSPTGGRRQMAGPGGPRGHQMLRPTCWQWLPAVHGAALRPLAPDVRNPGGGWQASQPEAVL